MTFKAEIQEKRQELGKSLTNVGQRARVCLEINKIRNHLNMYNIIYMGKKYSLDLQSKAVSVP